MADLKLGNILPVGADQLVVNGKYVKGSMFVAATTAERDSLSSAEGQGVIISGSLCLVQADNILYRYNGTSWVVAATDFQASMTTAESDSNGLMSKEDKAKLDAYSESSETTGASNKGVYLNNGEITECSHSVDVDVPSTAVFTDQTYSGIAYSDTATATAEKAATCPKFALEANQRILLNLTVSSTVAEATLNVNSTGAKPIHIDSAATTADNLTAGWYVCVYDGTNWNLSAMMSATDTTIDW